MVAAVTVSDVFAAQGLAAQLPFLLLVLAILSTRYKRARAMVAAGAMVGLSNALLVDENGDRLLEWFERAAVVRRKQGYIPRAPK